MEVIELVVEYAEVISRARIAVRLRVCRRPPHPDTDLSHVLDQPPGSRRQQRRHALRSSQRDVLHEITASLELGHDPQHGHQHPQAARGRAGHGDELAVDQFLDRKLQRVNGLISGHDDSSRIAIVVEEGSRRRRQALAHHRKQPQNLLVDVSERRLDGERRWSSSRSLPPSDARR